MRWMWMVAVMSACTGGAGSATDTGVEDTGGTDGVGCAALDVVACEADRSCEVAEGVPTSVENVDPSDLDSDSCWVESGEPEALGCMPADQVCPAEVILVGLETGDSDPWVLYNGCIPSGYERVAVEMEECPDEM